MFREEIIGGLDGVLSDCFFVEGVNLIAGGHGLGNKAVGVAGFNNTTGEEPEEFILRIDDGEGAEAKAACLNVFEDFADALIGGGFDGFLDKTVNVVFDTGDFMYLLFVAHIVMDEPEAAVKGHLNCHLGLRDGVHVGGYDGDLQFQTGRKLRRETGLLGQDLGI